MDLGRLFPAGSVCLISQTPTTRTWRITNINVQALNYLRIWLTDNLYSIAINWVQIQRNTTSMPDEYISHRLGLIPIVGDPELLDDFLEDNPDLCSAETCLRFELNVNNPGPDIKNVTSADLRWMPIGDQEDFLVDREPRPLYNDLIITKLMPGQEINLTAHAIRGTNIEHAKWSQTFVHYGMFPTRSGAFAAGAISGCVPCQQYVNVNISPGANCFHFIIELVGGLTFDDIQRQLDERFTWTGGPGFGPTSYVF